MASMTMDVIQSIPNLDWLSVWVKAYAFIHAGDNQRAINTIWSVQRRLAADCWLLCLMSFFSFVCPQLSGEEVPVTGQCGPAGEPG